MSDASERDSGNPPILIFTLCLLSEYVQAFKLLEHLDCSSSLASLQDQDSSVVQVVIGSGKPR